MKCTFRHSDKWGVIEERGEIIKWKVNTDGKLYAEIRPDEKIPSIDDTIDVLHCSVEPDEMIFE